MCHFISLQWSPPTCHFNSTIMLKEHELMEQKDMTFDQDLLLHSPFLFPPKKKRGKRKGE